MFICIDDVGQEHLDKLYKLDTLKRQIPALKINAFVIAENMSQYLRDWLAQDWIKAYCHGWSHSEKPELEKENAKELTEKALKEIGSNIYRAPGWQIMASSYPILWDLGVKAIIHKDKTQLRDKVIPLQLINLHIYDEPLIVPRGTYEFISEAI